MKILFLGINRRNSYLQFLALNKIYKNVDIIVPQKSFFFPYITKKIFIHISPKIHEPILNHYILSRVKKNYDLIFVKSGEFVGKKLILQLKKRTKKIVFNCNDNPFVSRDKNRWKLFLPACKYYDLIAFQDQSRIAPSKRFGVKKTLIVLPAYQKNIHCPQKISSREKKKYNNDVIFIGTWHPERGIFFKKLIDMGLNLKIYGNGWEKDANYRFLQSKIVLGQVNHPLYSKLIQCAKIALCQLSKGNLDSITKRSVEIPAIGTLLCAPRTKAHKNVFIENKEAIFFGNVNECFRKCKSLLSNINKINKISYSGHIKVTKILKQDNEAMVKKIVSKVLEDM